MNVKSRFSDQQTAPKAQQGAVLILSLVLLVVLTLLGVSVMNMTQLEERMASNMQEVTQAFQSAETGVSAAYGDEQTWDVTDSLKVSMAPIKSEVGRTDSAGYEVNFIVVSLPPEGFTLGKFESANFNIRGTGTSGSGYSNVLHAGGVRVVRAGAL